MHLCAVGQNNFGNKILNLNISWGKEMNKNIVSFDIFFVYLTFSDLDM